MAALVAVFTAWTSFCSSAFQLFSSGYVLPSTVPDFSLETVWAALLAVLPVWVCGALVGLLLPRPKWFGNGSRTSALMFTIPGSGFRRLALLYHAAVLVREVWCHTTKPGTFRRIVRAGLGFFVQQEPEGIKNAGSAQMESKDTDDSWIVSEKDLAFFKYRTEQDGELPGVSSWELMLQKEIPGVMIYKAWRRTLHGGGTEYKSVTIAADATSEEIMDMYLDDDFRPKWDNMIIKHDIVQRADFSKRQLVVHWIRRFPFHFLSDREYLIARQIFREPEAVYAISKGIQNHPDAKLNPKLVQMEDFYSMWRSKTIECPWGSDRPASETTLLHYEQFKIPENLARFAVRHGMWGFVKNLGGMLPAYLETRRTKCDPYTIDSTAYGAAISAATSAVTPAPVMSHRKATRGAKKQTEQDARPVEVVEVKQSQTDSLAADVSENKKARRKRRVNGVITFFVATTLALACKRSMEHTRSRK